MQMFTDFVDECRAHKLLLPKVTPVDVTPGLKTVPGYTVPRREVTAAA